MEQEGDGMSSVLVKGMKMPQGSCEWVDKDCHLHRCKLLNGDDDCKMQEGLCSTITWQEQSANCPLIEVPPHGDLTDKDKLMQEFMDSDLDHLQRDDWKEVIQIVADAPTIIEAEGSENEAD